jgi:hypothetical protein
LNIAHCLNTETGTFLNSTIPTRIRDWAIKLDKPWIFPTSYDSISEKQNKKKVHHTVIKIANSAISDIKKKHQDIEHKSFGITCRTSNQKMGSLRDTYYAIPYFLEAQIVMYLLGRQSSKEMSLKVNSLMIQIRLHHLILMYYWVLVAMSKRLPVTSQKQCLQNPYQDRTHWS